MGGKGKKEIESNKAVWLAKIEAGEIVSIPPEKKENVEDLPRWVKTALVLWKVDGNSYKEAAARFNKAGGTLSSYARSPAGRKWLSSLESFIEDPVAMAKAYLSANALSVTLERFIFLQAAIDAGDYATGDKIAKDLQDRMGIVAKKADAGAVSVKINFGGANFDAPVVEAEWTTEGDDEE
jgi:hypothetical protein